MDGALRVSRFADMLTVAGNVAWMPRGSSEISHIGLGLYSGGPFCVNMCSRAGWLVKIFPFGLLGPEICMKQGGLDTCSFLRELVFENTCRAPLT